MLLADVENVSYLYYHLFIMDEINIELKKNSVSENGMSPLTISTISPDASTTTSDTPTPPNGIHNENWATRYQTIGGKFFIFCRFSN